MKDPDPRRFPTCPRSSACLRIAEAAALRWRDVDTSDERLAATIPNLHFRGGRYWFRTSDLCRVKAALSR